ncbi:CoB--CoM heterodisulfide reductase iron-sulfur subunit B family protein [Nanoarchaeota archaeon]
MKYLFYPGCNAEQVEKEALTSTKAVCGNLGIELEYASDFSCCGATHVDKVDGFLNLLVNARNFARAEQKGMDVMTICNTCYIVMKRVKKKLENDELRGEVNVELSKIGLRYKGTQDVKHFFDVLHEFGTDELRSRVVRELGLRVGPFYGCHILRPESELGVEKEETEDKVDEILEAVGCEVVNYEHESKCCGFHITMANPDVCAKMNGRNLLSAKEFEVDVVVTPCTLCHTVMDGQQHRAEKAVGEKIRMPVLHLPQIVGLALGIDEKTLGLGRHVVSCKEVLNKGYAEQGEELSEEYNEDHLELDNEESQEGGDQSFDELEVPKP